MTDDEVLAEPVVVQDEESEESEEGFLPTYTILSYGADLDVEVLVNRLRKREIEYPQFQRQFVWDKRRCARFIESLLMGLPVPGIFLWRDPSTLRLSVIDGQQRLRTLEAFYDGILRGKEFIVPERTSPYQKVAPRFQGRNYRTLDDEDRRRLDTAIIHATVVNQERPPADDSSLFYIFERLNTEDTPLSAQEIRVAIYQGPLIELLDALRGLPQWQRVYGRLSPRLKDAELILRFFALFHNLANYARPMKEFVNLYASANRDLTINSENDLRSLSSDTIAAVDEALGPAAFRPEAALNAAVFDAVMVAIARRLEQGPITNKSALSQAHATLLGHVDFIDAYSRATSDAESVRSRIARATEAFRLIP